MDYVLLQSSLQNLLAQLAVVEAGTTGINEALPTPATTTSNLALSQQIIQSNDFCKTSAALNAELTALLAQLTEYAGGPCGPVPEVVCNVDAVFF
jgi:hypothetical protein